MQTLVACYIPAGPREPDLGMDSIEIDDSDLTTSYMEVNFPLKIRMEPASPGSSWINLVFDEIGANNNKPSSDKESSTAAVRQGELAVNNIA